MAQDSNKTGPVKKSVAELFESLEYGPAPEAPDAVHKWIADHGGKFGHFIDNKWVHPEGRKYLTGKSPKDMKSLCETVQGTAEDVEVAVASSVKAQKKWAAMPGYERAKCLYNIARNVQKHARLLAVMEALDNGKTIRETRDADIPIVARWFYHYAGWAQLMDEEMEGWGPIGVVGAIVPWNFPIMLMTWKVAPALAMGNTVVLKPASYTRMSALMFAEICAESGLPDGVLNILTGDGRMGSTLAAHNDVDKVGFTGSTGIGQLLRRLTAGTGKKISLELGGKSANIIYDSADLDAAVEGVVDAIWFNQGQVCSAGSRLLVQETVYDKVIAKIKRRMTKLRVGDSLDKCMDMGPLVDESQIESVGKYVQIAREEGNDVYQACECIPPKGTGLYFPPTLITNCQTTSTCVQEEIFGPVLVCLPFRTAKEAVAIANQSCYGLACGVWTEKAALGFETALSVKAGVCWINSYNLFDAAAGFGGYRESGFGRDGGKECLFEYAKPRWQKRVHNTLDENKVKNFGKSVPPAPKIGGSSTGGIDHTSKMYIGGKQARPDATYTRAICNSDGLLVGQVGEGNRKDIRDAVEAAHSAAPGWGKRAAFNRAQICYYIAENLQLRRDEYAQKLHAMTERSMAICEQEVDLSIQRLFYWAAYADKYGGTVQETTLYGVTARVNEPTGVIGILCPDDAPLLSFISLLAPAVVRSNTIVIVPSQKYPLAAIDIYQVLDTSDLPGGVINIVTGDRDTLALTMVDHQDMEAIWYFGGSPEGSKVIEARSAQNVKRTWVDYGQSRDWADPAQGQGREFLYHATEVKNVWLPMGETYAN